MNELADEDRAIYEWQLDVPGFGEKGQAVLRNSTALVSRAGGLGGPLCFSLAAAGIGKLIIAHAGDLRVDDLNRQILMRSGGVDRPRVESIRKTLAAFNPRIEVEVVPENLSKENVKQLVSGADIAFGAAPLFEERFLLNEACVSKGIPLIDCAMFNLEGHVIPILPGTSPCLACLYPETPPHWKRRFPVIGAVSALAANIGAMEGIKALTGLGETQYGKMIHFDTATMSFQKIVIHRNPECTICASIP
ncbi:MAG: HesA/MoeB/ThiF family protein [Verrucomicrobiales bacterium]|nr:HesA/MoeB/ThiF family protein [Verrucomicrobiales bacterium]